MLTVLIGIYLMFNGFYLTGGYIVFLGICYMIVDRLFDYVPKKTQLQ